MQNKIDFHQQNSKRSYPFAACKGKKILNRQPRVSVSDFVSIHLYLYVHIHNAYTSSNALSPYHTRTVDELKYVTASCLLGFCFLFLFSFSSAAGNIGQRFLANFSRGQHARGGLFHQCRKFYRGCSAFTIRAYLYNKLYREIIMLLRARSRV